VRSLSPTPEAIPCPEEPVERLGYVRIHGNYEYPSVYQFSQNLFGCSIVPIEFGSRPE